MKNLFIISSFFVCIPLYAQSLKCSTNGTDVYYINGVLTSADKNFKDKESIKALINSRSAILDSGPKIAGLPPVNFIGIHNPSYGAINDAAELFAQAYYIKTGQNDNAKSIYNVIKNLPAATLQDKTQYDPSGFFSSLSRFVTLNSANYGTLINIAEEANQEAIKRSMASVDTLLKENDTISAAVRGYFVLSKSSKRKILVVAHSQGNAVVNSAFRKISDSADNDEINYMSKYSGVFHVASPVAPLKAPYKSRNIRTNQDLMIQIAERLGLPVTGITHDIVSRSPSDFSGHLFYDTYLSPNVLVRPHGNTTASPVSMSENFVSTLSDLATDLEDNCTSPDIDIAVNGAIRSTTDPTTFNYQGFTNLSNNITITAKDKNDSDNSTQFKFDYYIFDINEFLYNETKIYTGIIFPPRSQEGVNSISDFSIPFSKNLYSLRIHATNKAGKVSIQDFRVVVDQDQAPTASIYLKECFQNGSGGFGILALFDDLDSPTVFLSNSSDANYDYPFSAAPVREVPRGFNWIHQSYGDMTLYYYSSLGSERKVLNVPACTCQGMVCN